MISILFPFVHLLIIKIIIQKVKTLLISQFASSSASSWGKYGDQSSSYHTPSHPSASPAPSYNPHGNLRRILRAHGWVIHRSMRSDIFCTHHRKIHEIVEENGGQYHVLLIISDGQIKKAVLELELKHAGVRLLFRRDFSVMGVSECEERRSIDGLGDATA
ncbi:hypothetical protein YC2023_022026 [Brassica napus]